MLCVKGVKGFLTHAEVIWTPRDGLMDLIQSKAIKGCCEFISDTVPVHQQGERLPWALPERRSVSSGCPAAGRPPWRSTLPNPRTQSELQTSDCRTPSCCAQPQSGARSWQTAGRDRVTTHLRRGSYLVWIEKPQIAFVGQTWTAP